MAFESFKNLSKYITQKKPGSNVDQEKFVDGQPIQKNEIPIDELVSQGVTQIRVVTKNNSYTFKLVNETNGNTRFELVDTSSERAKSSIGEISGMLADQEQPAPVIIKGERLICSAGNLSPVKDVIPSLR